MPLNISKGKKKRAQRVVIYGCEGIGKTTLASQCPEPIFIDLESGSDQLDCSRVDGVETWNQLANALAEIVKAEEPICKTVVIDTADKAEALCTKAICQEKKVNGIEDIGYGKGYTYIGEQFGAMLSYLDLIIKKGIHVVVIAHAMMRKFEQPDEKGAYDRWELKLSKKCAPILKEWADALLFCNYRTTVFEGKPTGKERVIYADHHPCWDAKNRFGLPEVFEMKYENIKRIFEEE